MLRRFGNTLLGLVGVGGNRFKARLETPRPGENDKAHDAALKPKKQRIRRIYTGGFLGNDLITCKGNGRSHVHRGGIYKGLCR